MVIYIHTNVIESSIDEITKQFQVVLEDINECAEMDNICENGRCANTFGSFACNCNPGFTHDNSRTSCIGAAFWIH